MNRRRVKAFCLGCLRERKLERTMAFWRCINKLISQGWLPSNPWKNAPETMRRMMKHLEEDSVFIQALDRQIPE